MFDSHHCNWSISYDMFSFLLVLCILTCAYFLWRCFRTKHVSIPVDKPSSSVLKPDLDSNPTSAHFDSARAPQMEFTPTFPPSPALPISARHSYYSTPKDTTIKLIHQNPSFRCFSGTDPDYGPSSFLQSCEDAMRNTDITQEADMIAFVRSHIEQDSLAWCLMSASAFSPRHLGDSYSAFRANFLEAFNSPTTTSMNWVHKLRSLLSVQFASLDRLRAMSASTEIADAAVEGLYNDWFVNGQMSLRIFRNLMEFMTYSLLLQPNEHRCAAATEFRADDSLLSFSTRIGRKCSQSPILPVHSPVQTPVVSSVPPASSTSPPPPSTPSTKSIKCDYCGRLGHSVRYCYQRKKHSRASKTPSTEDPLPPFSSSERRKSSPRPSSPSPRRRSNTVSFTSDPSNYPTPSPWCILHEVPSHATEDCRALRALKAKSTSDKRDFHRRRGTIRRT